MCIFFSLAPLDINPPPTLRVHAINLVLGLILKSKDHLSIFDNIASSTTSVFRSVIFKKWSKTLFLGVSPPFFSQKLDVMESWIYLQHAKSLRKHLCDLICKTHAGLCYLYCIMYEWQNLQFTASSEC